MASEERTIRLMAEDLLNDDGVPAVRFALLSVNERRRKARADYLEWSSGGRLDQGLIDSQTTLYEGLMQDLHNIHVWARSRGVDLKALALNEVSRFPEIMGHLGYNSRWREYYVLLELAQAAWGVYETGMYKDIPEFSEALGGLRKTEQWRASERERSEVRLARGYWQGDAILAQKRARERSRYSLLSQEARDERNRLLREKRARQRALRSSRDTLYDELTSSQAAE